MDTTYIDDDAIVITSRRAEHLVEDVVKAPPIITTVYTNHRLQLNSSLGKTQAVLAFRGDGAK